MSMEKIIENLMDSPEGLPRTSPPRSTRAEVVYHDG